MKNKLTVIQAVFLAEKADKLFRRAAYAWEYGQNSGDGKTMSRCDKLSTKLQKQAEALLKPLGIIVDYPGLYPSFTVKGFAEHSTLAAISAALDSSRKQVAA